MYLALPINPKPKVKRGNKLRTRSWAKRKKCEQFRFQSVEKERNRSHQRRGRMWRNFVEETSNRKMREQFKCWKHARFNTVSDAPWFLLFFILFCCPFPWIHFICFLLAQIHWAGAVLWRSKRAKAINYILFQAKRGNWNWPNSKNVKWKTTNCVARSLNAEHIEHRMCQIYFKRGCDPARFIIAA